MSLSEKIIHSISLAKEQSPILNLGDRRTMARNLCWLYQVMTGSENLMRVALDDASPTLRTYLEHHRGEEKDHAKWLADDLAEWGIDASEVPLMRSAAELVGIQYYLIFHRSPNALLGYMAVLEGFPFPLPALEQLENIHGKEVLRCLRYHAENDIEHRKELFRVIDKINDPIIFDNAMRTQFLIDEAFRADK